MSRKDDNAILFGLLSLMSILPVAAWKGWVLARLWLWFIVPLGAAPLGVWHATGIALIVGWIADSNAVFMNIAHEDERSPMVKYMTSTGYGVLVPLLVWGFGTIYHAWM